MLTYAGIPLMLPTPEIKAWIANNLSPRDMTEFVARHWPGRNLKGLTFLDRSPFWPPKISTLQWPQGASRFAVGHFLITDTEWTAVKQVLGNAWAPLEFVMSWIDAKTGNQRGAIRTYLYALPPRPLSGLSGTNPSSGKPYNGVYLLTLVDERFYWWRHNTGAIGFNASATWNDLYAILAAELGISIAVDAINVAYGRPDNHADWNRQYETIPLILDACAYNVGQRIVRTYNGSVRAMGYASSKTTFEANVAAAGPLIAGGLFTWPLPQAL